MLSEQNEVRPCTLQKSHIVTHHGSQCHRGTLKASKRTADNDCAGFTVFIFYQSADPLSNPIRNTGELSPRQMGHREND